MSRTLAYEKNLFPPEHVCASVRTKSSLPGHMRYHAYCVPSTRDGGVFAFNRLLGVTQLQKSIVSNIVGKYLF